MFCLTAPRISVGGSFTVALISGIEKVWIRGGGGVSRFSVENFLSHSAKNFRRVILYCCIIFRYRKSLEKRGVSRFSVEIFWSHSAEKFRRGILYCCINFGYRKSLDRRGGGVVSRFSVEIFCLTVAKTFVGESFFVVLISVTEKFWRRGGVSRFYVENVLSHSAENFRRGILYCCNNFGYRKSLDKRGGGYRVFPYKFFCLTVPEIFVGESFTVVIFSDTEKV